MPDATRHITLFLELDPCHPPQVGTDVHRVTRPLH